MSRNAGSCTAQREAAAPRRRTGKAGESRSTRRGMKLADAELDELVIASALVPTGQTVRKSSIDFESEMLSTAEPSSAEQTPELNCMVSEIENWPSLRAAVESGWDFCSEGSDSEDMWEDLPSPLVPVDAPEHEPQSPTSEPLANWLLVTGNDGASEQASTKISAESEEAPKLTFADLLREQESRNETVPPAAGTAMPAIRARPMQRRTGYAGEAGDSQDQSMPVVDEHAADKDRSRAQRGWKKEHKASRNTKQQRKVAEREARRNAQSWESRGWLDEEEKEEQAEV